MSFVEIQARKANGMLSGLFVCLVFGALWVWMALGFWQARPEWSFPALLAAAVLLGFWILLRRPAIRRAAESDTRPLRSYTGLFYWTVVALEVVAILAAVNLLGHAHRGEMIPFAVAAIVGAHFLPLAWLFRVTAYYWAGIAMVVWAGVCLLIVDRVSGAVALGFGMGAILWTVAIHALIRMKR